MHGTKSCIYTGYYCGVDCVIDEQCHKGEITFYFPQNPSSSSLSLSSAISAVSGYVGKRGAAVGDNKRLTFVSKNALKEGVEMDFFRRLPRLVLVEDASSSSSSMSRSHDLVGRTGVRSGDVAPGSPSLGHPSFDCDVDLREAKEPNMLLRVAPMDLRSLSPTERDPGGWL